MKVFYVIIAAALIALNNNTVYSQVTEEWVARFNGPGNGWDGASSIAVDDSGRVYATGLQAESIYTNCRQAIIFKRRR